MGCNDRNLFSRQRPVLPLRLTRAYLGLSAARDFRRAVDLQTDRSPQMTGTSRIGMSCFAPAAAGSAIKRIEKYAGMIAQAAGKGIIWLAGGGVRSSPERWEGAGS
jgi:copper homeostasis protein CutC